MLYNEILKMKGVIFFKLSDSIYENLAVWQKYFRLLVHTFLLGFPDLSEYALFPPVYTKEFLSFLTW